jgi:hypothetical protein
LKQVAPTNRRRADDLVKGFSSREVVCNSFDDLVAMSSYGAFASSVLHPASCIQHLHPASCVLHPASCVQMDVDKLDDPGCRRKLIAEVLCDLRLLAVTRDLDCFEVFAGVGSVAKAAAELGHNSATFGKADNESDDICTTDGLHRAVHFLIGSKKAACFGQHRFAGLGGWMNSCKCKRTQEDDFMGDLSYAPVQEGNSMANATALLMELAHHRGVRVALENSSGSKIFKYKPMAELRATLDMHTVTTNRCAFDTAARGKRLLKPYQLFAAGCSVSRRGVSGCKNPHKVCVFFSGALFSAHCYTT